MLLALVVVTTNITLVFKSHLLKILKNDHAGDRINAAWNPTNHKDSISFSLLQMMLSKCFHVCCEGVYIDTSIYLLMYYI